MERIASEQSFRSICATGLGVVFNDFAGHGASGAQYNVVHAATCRWLARSNLSVPKIWFEDLETATSWLERERGLEGRAWKRCGTCQARGSAPMPSMSAERPPPHPEPGGAGGSNPGYLIALDEPGSRVDAWSTTRLPFEPNGAMLEFRAGLRSTVARLSADSSHALHAMYTWPLGGRFDVENVLVYNVGTSAFARSAGFELVVERLLGSVPPPPRPLEGSAHHYAYTIMEREVPWRAWSTVRRLASFESEEVRSLAEVARPASVWLAIRRGDTSVHAAASDSSTIGLEITVELLRGARVNLATLAKPLIDGTIAAFHEHGDSASLDLVASRVGAQISVPDEDVRSLLSRNAAAILGSRRLLWPWRDGVQWNPADDRCSAVRIGCESRDATDQDGGVRICGSLVEIAPTSL